MRGIVGHIKDDVSSSPPCPISTLFESNRGSVTWTLYGGGVGGCHMGWGRTHWADGGREHTGLVEEVEIAIVFTVAHTEVLTPIYSRLLLCRFISIIHGNMCVGWRRGAESCGNLKGQCNKIVRIQYFKVKHRQLISLQNNQNYRIFSILIFLHRDIE